jgi:hypothetical protein
VLDRFKLLLGTNLLPLWFSWLSTSLIIAFLFFNMFGLTVLYCILFFFIRLHSKKFPNYTSSDRRASVYESQSWHANLETGGPRPPTTSQEILTTQTVVVTSEDRPRGFQAQPPTSRGESKKRMNQIAITLLCYPIIYICLALPIAITRISQFAGGEVGFTAIYISVCMYSCSGWVNVLLYTATRKGIVSWGKIFKRKSAMPIARPMEWYPTSRHAPAESIESVGTMATKTSGQWMSVSQPSPVEGNAADLH